MKARRHYQFVVIVLTLIAGSVLAAEDAPSSITYSHSFGNCDGYCSYEIAVTRKRVTLKARGSRETKALPPIRLTEATSNSEWDDLLRMVHARSFLSLQDRVGGTPMHEMERAWVELRFPSGNAKRVAFNDGHVPAEIEALEARLQTIADRFKLPRNSVFIAREAREARSLNELQEEIARAILNGNKPKVCGDIAYFPLESAVDGPSAYVNVRTNEIVSVCGGACWHPRSLVQKDVCRTMCPPPAWRAKKCV